jgi:hypothetical protein
MCYSVTLLPLVDGWPCDGGRKYTAEGEIVAMVIGIKSPTKWTEKEKNAEKLKKMRKNLESTGSS